MRAAALAALLALGAAPAAAQTADTLAARDTAATRTPRGAVTRALLLPGLGQLYNRQPVKAPIAAALVAGAVVFAVDRQRQYLLFRRATVYAGCLVDDGVPDTPSQAQDNGRVRLCGEVAPDYEDEWVAVGRRDFGELGRSGGLRDRARGQRDIGVLVVGVAYAFQALDAYVAAELTTFDVSEDLAVRVDPGPGPPTVALRLRLD